MVGRTGRHSSLAAGVTAFALLTRGFEPPDVFAPGDLAVQGLPTAPDYHSLLVSGHNSRRLLLGTHDGVYASIDGGKTWRPTMLVGEDAMTLEPAQDSLVWAAGHGVLALSDDAGDTWNAVRPEGPVSTSTPSRSTQLAAQVSMRRGR